MHDQCIIQVNPKRKPLIAVQVDRVYFCKLLNKYSVRQKKILIFISHSVAIKKTTWPLEDNHNENRKGPFNEEVNVH